MIAKFNSPLYEAIATRKMFFTCRQTGICELCKKKISSKFKCNKDYIYSAIRVYSNYRCNYIDKEDNPSKQDIINEFNDSAKYLCDHWEEFCEQTNGIVYMITDAGFVTLRDADLGMYEDIKKDHSNFFKYIQGDRFKYPFGGVIFINDMIAETVNDNISYENYLYYSPQVGELFVVVTDHKGIILSDFHYVYKPEEDDVSCYANGYDGSTEEEYERASVLSLIVIALVENNKEFLLCDGKMIGKLEKIESCESNYIINGSKVKFLKY